MLVPLMGRNPFALLSVLLAVIAVREALPAEVRSGWGWVIKLGIVFIAISVLFNVLTVRVGDRVIGHCARLAAAAERRPDAEFGGLRFA